MVRIEATLGVVAQLISQRNKAATAKMSRQIVSTLISIPESLWSTVLVSTSPVTVVLW